MRPRLSRSAAATLLAGVLAGVTVSLSAIPSRAVGPVPVVSVSAISVSVPSVGPLDAPADALAPASRLAFVPPKVIESRHIGSSVLGRPIVAYRMGTPGGRPVMLVGMIHGDETKGALITERMRTLPTPVGIDLWLIDTMNPDGFAAGTRENANGVDLNRNFEEGWNYIPMSTAHHQYSGEHPADQPETQAVQDFIREIAPEIGIWYHQDANTISLNGARREIPTAYGLLVGLEPGTVPCSQLCTGTAGTFGNRTILGSTNFLVELPGSAAVDESMVLRHALAVIKVTLL